MPDDAAGAPGGQQTWLLAGASGFLGGELGRALSADGVRVRRLVRHAPTSRDEIAWNAATPPRPEVLAGVDVVVCLSGLSLMRPWTARARQEILDSRVQPTLALARAVAALPAGTAPHLVCQSGTGAYPKNTGRVFTEADEVAADGFLPQVVRAWEDAAAPAREAGAAVTHLRSGVVLSPRGGALRILQVPSRLGAGVPLGSGDQVMPLLALPDWIAAVRFVVSRGITGPVNLTIPQPATNADLTRAVNAAVHRWTLPAVKVPARLLRRALGGFSTELLDSVDVRPPALLEAGFAFTGADVRAAVAAAYAG